MSKMPTLFVSHGGPNVVTDPSDARTFLTQLSTHVPRPSAILINSAHFEAPGPAVVRDPAPGMIYDFNGFAPELHSMVFPAPGNTALADKVTDLLSAAGHQPAPIEQRGYDHGTWNPLILAFPDADIPVVQVSTDPDRDAAWHHSVGAALEPLRDEGVLVIGSGHITHNLREVIGMMRGMLGTPDFPGHVAAFTDWFHEVLREGRTDDLLNWRTKAPFPSENHPTDEHLLPIFTAYGAAGEGAKGERIHASTQFDGAFAWDAYRFE